MSALGDDLWVLVVPVKEGRIAKSRLADFAGDQRPALARAMAADCVAAALACPLVASVVAVTDDVPAADLLRSVGARVVPDAPRAGINTAVEFGATSAFDCAPAGGVGALSGDLPALRSAELTAALAGAPQGRSFVADAAGTGTTLLLARTGTTLTPRFGPASRAAHLASGAVEISGGELPSLRRDVDTPLDLRQAVQLGVGPRTAAVLASLAAQPTRH